MDKNLRSKDSSYITIFKLSKSYSFNTNFGWIPFNISKCRMLHFTVLLIINVIWKCIVIQYLHLLLYVNDNVECLCIYFECLCIYFECLCIYLTGTELSKNNLIWFAYCNLIGWSVWRTFWLYLITCVWYYDVTSIFIRQQQIQIVTQNNRNQNRGIIKFYSKN